LKQNVIALFGINGVGKSTIAHALHETIFGSVMLSGSELLMHSFKGLNREQLEMLSPEEKMRMLESAFLDAFEQNREAKLIILDTHLVVTIRKNGKLILENVWSERFSPYSNFVFFISSNPMEILQRRMRDSRISGRRRDLDVEHIRVDQTINLSVFEETFSETKKSHVIPNEESHMEDTVTSIRRAIS